MILSKEELVSNLIEKFLEGDKSCFVKILKLISSDVINLAYYYTHNLEDAKDIFQEVSIKIFKYLKFFKKKAKFTTWVYRIAVNTCIDFLRKKKKTMVMKEEIMKDENFSREELEDRERLKMIRETLNNLPPKAKTVFILRHYQGLKIVEISRILGCSESSVKTHLTRAIAIIRKNLEER
ncbi:MAG: RNA polymerase sigma factor [Candidatus Omnitrophica bacterium]|nr:RNA polymerase sigma factor [Candidatus Omnitrophota bacterium]